MGSKKETINRIFQELKERGMIRNKKEFATLLGVNYAGLVAAMNGNEKYLTDSLVAKAVSLLPDNEPIPKKTRRPHGIRVKPHYTINQRFHMKRICSSPSNILWEQIVNPAPPPDKEAAIYRALVDYIFKNRRRTA